MHQSIDKALLRILSAYLVAWAILSFVSCNNGNKQIESAGGQKDFNHGSSSASQKSWAAALGEPSFDGATEQPKIRLLSGLEYSNTVKSLLGVDPSKFYQYSDEAPGFSNGSGLTLDENLFSGLFVEAEYLAQQYVSQYAAQQYPCLFQINNGQLNQPCLKSFAEEFVTRAYRRPLTPDEVKDLITSFQNFFAAAGNDMESSLTLFLRKILMSPHFLYRTEIGWSYANGKKLLRPYEIASSISYTLTGDMPDDLLLQDVLRDRFTPEQAAVHVNRIIATEKSQNWIVLFFKQWLKLQALDRMTNIEEFSKFESSQQGAAMQQEFHSYVKSMVFDEKADLEELMLSTNIPVNQYTAPLYNLSQSGDDFIITDIGESTRRGILMLASVMAAHSASSTADKDSPVRRGVMIQERVLCQSIGLPSGISTNDAATNARTQVPDFDSYTIRRQMEIMMQQGESCKSCHKSFMPYGFMLSNFDALGRFQNNQRGNPIDSSVEAAPLENEAKSYKDFTEFLVDLASSTVAKECFSQQWAKFIYGSAAGGSISAFKEYFGSQMAKNNHPLIKLFSDSMLLPETHVRGGNP